MSAIGERSHTNRTRAESFGAGAEAYDRARPSYPPALIDDLLLGHPHDVLDVGCGTGKAARLIAERGVPVLGVEIDERMASVARSHGVDVEIGGFEAWDPAGRRFDLIVCGQAWHWLDPAVAVPKAAALLRPGGLLAVFWNFSAVAPPLRQRLDTVYERIVPQISERSVVRNGGPATVPSQVDELRASGALAGVEQRRYPWDRDYTRDEWLDLIRTHSDHATLPPGRLAALVRAVSRAIVDSGGVVHAHYVTETILART